MMQRTSTFALLATLFLSTETLAQSLNLDFHDGAGVPSSDYGAAGRPGVWNVLATISGGPFPLVGLDGLAAGITVTQSGAAELQTLGITGIHAPLINDRFVSHFPIITLDFDGLDAGTYEVITYSVSTVPRDISITINDDPATAFAYVTEWSGSLVLGQTHALHLVDVFDGTLRITVENIGDDAFVNGVQLGLIVPAPGVFPAFLLAVGWRPRRRRPA